MEAISWATPSCISRASRRRSSVVAASRNALKRTAVSRWTALGSSCSASSVRRASRRTPSGCRPSVSIPDTTATRPTSVISGKANAVAVARRAQRAAGLRSQDLQGDQGPGGATGLDDERAEVVAARDMDGESRDRQLVANPARDRGSERDRVQSGAEPPRQVDQLAEQRLRVAVRRQGVVRGVQGGPHEAADQAETDAGHDPGERAGALGGVEAAVQHGAEHDERDQLGREGQHHPARAAMQRGRERRDRERAEHRERRLDGQCRDDADQGGLEQGDEQSVDSQRLGDAGRHPDGPHGEEGEDAAVVA